MNAHLEHREHRRTYLARYSLDGVELPVPASTWRVADQAGTSRYRPRTLTIVLAWDKGWMLNYARLKGPRVKKDGGDSSVNYTMEVTHLDRLPDFTRDLVEDVFTLAFRTDATVREVTS